MNDDLDQGPVKTGMAVRPFDRALAGCAWLALLVLLAAALFGGIMMLISLFGKE